MKAVFKHCCLFLTTLILVACGGDESLKPTLPIPIDMSYLSAPEAPRKWLKIDELISSDYQQPSPIHNGYFVPVGEQQDAKHHFEADQIKCRAPEMYLPTLEITLFFRMCHCGLSVMEMI